MSLVIGIDFDNTIACYDQVFCDVAQKLGLLESATVLSKAQVKQTLWDSPEGDLSWQRLQGKVYGKYMHLASMFPGFFEFLHFASLQGHQLFIVSHKSEFGHFDEEKISLRDAAMDWMYDRKIVGSNKFQLNKKDIFFAATRELKVKKIRELQCDIFIDDLIAVFDEPLFPDNTKKILFDPHKKQASSESRQSLHSWRQITKALLGDWSEADITTIAKNQFPNLEINTANIIKGRGNSRIYRLQGAKADYALKCYPDRQLDSRDRLNTEYLACKYLSDAGFPVMKAQDKSEPLNWAVYQWVSGQAISSKDDVFISEAVNFVKDLYEKSQQVTNRSDFSNASEACLSGHDIVEQIQVRLERFKAAGSNQLNNFLQKEFIPTFQSITETVKTHPDNFFATDLPQALQIISPSDFGAHNAIKNESGQAIFIDFEYFGWDDPVKLVSDFYWHPGMSLSVSDKQQWISATNEIFKNDLNYSERLSAYLPLYALRWCLIILNEFLPERLANRLNASNQDSSNVQQILDRQLHKSKLLLNQVIEDIPNYGSTLKIS